jgi:hypothetical protein
MYSGIGLGITMDFATEKINGESSTDRKLFPAGQLTSDGITLRSRLWWFY